MIITVTGADGMLGSAVVPYLRQCGHDVYATDIDDLDVRIRSDVKNGISGTNPQIVLHLAAETSLEASEADPDHAWLTNAIGTKNVALECAVSGIPMVYISSAGVFDGTKETAYTEFDTPSPINVYGASKLYGEKVMRELVPNSFCLRAGWMMGGGPERDHKFISHVMNQINDGATVIRAVIDKRGTPTYSKDFARCLESLITSDDYGTYHMTSPGSCTRYDVACAIVGFLDRPDVKVQPASSSLFAAEFSAPRPPSEAMRNYVLDLTGRGDQMRPWREALEDYLKDWR